MPKHLYMKRQIIFLFLLALQFSIKGYSQACGGGILTLNIYTLNGEKIKGASYEIFPVSKLLIEKYKNLNAWESGSVIGDFKETNFISNDSLTNRLQKFLERSSIAKSGKFKTNLKFKTIETVYFPIIIRVTIKNQTVYVFGNYFGGCNREARLLWNGKHIGLM